MKIDMTISTLMKINMTLILYTLLITCPSCLWKTITILLTINDSDVQKYTYAMIYCCFGLRCHFQSQYTSISLKTLIIMMVMKNFCRQDLWKGIQYDYRSLETNWSLRHKSIKHLMMIGYIYGQRWSMI